MEERRNEVVRRALERGHGGGGRNIPVIGGLLGLFGGMKRAEERAEEVEQEAEEVAKALAKSPTMTGGGGSAKTKAQEIKRDIQKKLFRRQCHPARVERGVNGTKVHGAT